MIPPIIPLRDFADPASLSLETREQARCVIRAIECHSRRWVELDFSGITSVNWEFAMKFIRLAQLEMPETWLVPKHYERNCAKLIHPLVSRLERLREEAWINGCELFSTGIDPQRKNKEKLK